MQQPEAYISEVDKPVDENGKVCNIQGDKLLRAFMDSFEKWVDRIADKNGIID